MSESTLDPIDAFVRHVRSIAADNQHIIVGPASHGGSENHYLVEIVVASTDPTRPFVTATWDFEIRPAGDNSPSMSAWDTWRFLAELLKRDFQHVERCGNEVEFTRAVEHRWPCPEATAARERFELKQQRREAWDARRSSYIARRVAEGVRYADAAAEFMKSNPQDC